MMAKMKKPRNIGDYTDKDAAEKFVFAMLDMVRREPPGMLLRLYVSYNRWHPDWEKPTVAGVPATAAPSRSGPDYPP